MAAARCPECGEYSVKQADGTAVIRHQPDCEMGNDFQPQLSETLSMRDIVVPSTLAELFGVVQRITEAWIADAEARDTLKWPEAHLVILYDATPDAAESMLELRGRVRNVADDGPEDELFRMISLWLESDTLRAVAYKSIDGEPEPMSSIDVSRSMRGGGSGIFEIDFAAVRLQQVSLVHEPSPRIPVVQS